MKGFFFIFLLFVGTSVTGQNSIKFNYDTAGNLTQRYIQIVNLRLKNEPQTNDSSLSFKVYPNPAKDHFFIEGSLKNDQKEAKVLLLNINGAIIKEDTYYGIKKAFSLVDCSNGVYFLDIKYSKNESNVYRLLITN